MHYFEFFASQWANTDHLPKELVLKDHKLISGKMHTLIPKKMGPFQKNAFCALYFRPRWAFPDLTQPLFNTAIFSFFFKKGVLIFFYKKVLVLLVETIKVVIE